MKISEIYRKYRIMPQLQEHMLRVSGVALIISENFRGKNDKKEIISTTLIHDLGNMAKIKLDRFPEFIQPQKTDYWEKVLAKFRQKYGNDDYTATYTILTELGIPKNIYNLTRSLEFAKSPQTAKGNNMKLKICLYSDARVSPHGVVSLKERLDEVKERYIKNKGVSERKFNQISEGLYKVEKQIFAHCTIKPEDITEEKAKPLINKLKSFNIKTK